MDSPITSLDSSSSPPPSQRRDPPAYRACATCKKLAIPPYIRMVNCERCRAVKRNQKRRNLEQKLERQALYTKTFSHDMDDSSSPAPHPQSPKSGLKENKHTGNAHAHAQPVKRTTSKALHELEGDAQNAAMKQMKKRVNILAQASKGVGNTAVAHILGTSHSAPGGKEYQTATALYDSLKKRLANTTTSLNKLKFNGYHAIVFVSTIDHLKRVELVANDLRKIVRLPFDHAKPNHTYDFKTMARTVTFQCTCLGHKSVSADARLMGAAPRVNMPKLCGGIVTVTAVDDRRHPLKILGQRITVRVEHN